MLICLWAVNDSLHSNSFLVTTHGNDCLWPNCWIQAEYNYITGHLQPENLRNKDKTKPKTKRNGTERNGTEIIEILIVLSSLFLFLAPDDNEKFRRLPSYPLLFPPPQTKKTKKRKKRALYVCPLGFVFAKTKNSYDVSRVHEPTANTL